MTANVVELFPDTWTVAMCPECGSDQWMVLSNREGDIDIDDLSWMSGMVCMNCGLEYYAGDEYEDGAGE